MRRTSARHLDNPVWKDVLIVGVVSFVTALTAIHFYLKWLNRFGMWPYVIYRLALALVFYLVLMK